MHDEHRKERHEQQKEKITSFACAVPAAPVPYNFAPMVPPTHTHKVQDYRKEEEEQKKVNCCFASTAQESMPLSKQQATARRQKTEDKQVEEEAQLHKLQPTVYGPVNFCI